MDSAVGWLCARNRRVRTRLTHCPKIPSHFDGLYLEVSPPRDLVAKAVQIPMVLTAQGHGEFVTDLAPEGSWLCKFEVMGIAGSSTALALRRPTH
jgi:hypothetical protein